MSREHVTRTYGVAVMVALAFVSYMSFTQPLPTRRPDQQTTMYSHIPTAADPNGRPPVAAAAAPGQALAHIRIPRFGKDWIWTVVEGTTLDDLAKGPGHYSGTPLPGGVGNAAIAGHRAGHGDPFIDFDRLRVGDEVILSQRDARWVYRLTTKPAIIEPDADWVIRPFASGRWLTLTTCWPRYGSAKRMYVRAVLE